MYNLFILYSSPIENKKLLKEVNLIKDQISRCERLLTSIHKGFFEYPDVFQYANYKKWLIWYKEFLEQDGYEDKYMELIPQIPYFFEDKKYIDYQRKLFCNNFPSYKTKFNMENLEQGTIHRIYCLPLDYKKKDRQKCIAIRKNYKILEYCRK